MWNVVRTKKKHVNVNLALHNPDIATSSSSRKREMERTSVSAHKQHAWLLIISENMRKALTKLKHGLVILETTLIQFRTKLFKISLEN